MVVDLEPAQDSIRGRVTDADDADGPDRSFEGWLELSALLDGLRPRPDTQLTYSIEDATP